MAIFSTIFWRIRRPGCRFANHPRGISGISIRPCRTVKQQQVPGRPEGGLCRADDAKGKGKGKGRRQKQKEKARSNSNYIRNSRSLELRPTPLKTRGKAETRGTSLAMTA